MKKSHNQTTSSMFWNPALFINTGWLLSQRRRGSKNIHILKSGGTWHICGEEAEILVDFKNSRDYDISQAIVKIYSKTYCASSIQHSHNTGIYQTIGNIARICPVQKINATGLIHTLSVYCTSSHQQCV